MKHENRSPLFFLSSLLFFFPLFLPPSELGIKSKLLLPLFPFAERGRERQTRRGGEKRKDSWGCGEKGKRRKGGKEREGALFDSVLPPPPPLFSSSLSEAERGRKEGEGEVCFTFLFLFPRKKEGEWSAAEWEKESYFNNFLYRSYRELSISVAAKTRYSFLEMGIDDKKSLRRC